MAKKIRRARAQRKATDRAPSRRTVIRRRLVALLIVFGVISAGYIVVFTSALGAKTVKIDGLAALSEQQVRDTAAIELGYPLARLDIEAIGDRVASLPRVAHVDVQRILPTTVRLTITERTPVASSKLSDGIHLIDRTGTDYAVVAKAPENIPELITAKSGNNIQDDVVLKAVVNVLTQLPESIRGQVAVLTAETSTDIRLVLKSDKQVRWGSPDNTKRKALVLEVLLTRSGSVFDVTSPELPTVF